jgi:two-component system OmpR family response regulator
VKLLLVEDDAKIAAAVRRGLEAEGFSVEHAADGVQGLWLATEGTWDAIVLDLMLPERNGFRVCRHLRAAGDWTPILVLTAKTGELDETEALDTGADDFLSKPFSFPVLVARLRALLRRGADPVPAEVGDLVVDRAAHTVRRADVEIALTARELAVLDLLVRRRGQVLSKQQILDAVWEFDFDGDPNIVEVFIRRLRTKVDEPFGRRSIETVRGAGYRVVDDGAQVG